MTTTEKTHSARIMLASMMDEEDGKAVDIVMATEGEEEEEERGRSK